MKTIIVKHFPAFFGWHHSTIILAHGGGGGHSADTIGIWLLGTIAVGIFAAILWGKKA